MAYSLFWRSPALPYIGKQTPISVPAGSVVSDAAPIRFTGKGAPNYGKIQQENMMRMVEHFAGPTAPDFPTVGMIWYDTVNNIPKVCISTAPQPIQWRSLNSTQIGQIDEPPPTPAALGDSWFSRTGSASGILYVYTGLGRYPAATWDAAAAGYFPADSVLQLAIDLNTSGFSNIGSNYGEAYIHGFSGNTPADVDGSILLNGVATTVPRGPMFTSNSVSNGFIVWDTVGNLVSTNATPTRFFAVRELGNGTWQYDDNAYWKDFTPQAGHHAIGLITIPEADNNQAPGISNAKIWAETRPLTTMQQVPATRAGGAIGGWSQVWPQIDVGAGRDEYDYVYSLVAQLIGDALAFGGNEALGRSVQDLTDFRTLDASMQRAWISLIPNDQNVLRSGDLLNKLKVEPNSQDWDRLLAAAKYAISRLELPPSFSDDISPLPFVSDGRPAPASLYALPTNNIRYPSEDRQVGRRPGIVTTLRQYQETINVLKAAIQNRYILKGMTGTSGVNTTFASNVTAIQQATFTSTTSLGTNPVTHGLVYRFDFTGPEIQKFFYAGQALELVLQHAPGSSPTTADTNLKNLIDANGRIRLTADYTYVMSRNSTPALSRQPIPIGYNSLTSNSTLTSITVGTATMTVRAGIVSGGVAIFVDITAGGATSGSTTAVWNYISDNESFTNPGTVRVFPAPLTYSGSDKQGSAFFN